MLSETDTAKLLHLARGTRLWISVLLAVTTGMRRGEIAALDWPHVDLDAATLTVVRSLEQTKGTLTFKTTKTAKGRRLIALQTVAVDALRRHKADQGKQRLRLGAAYDDQGLVCARPDGSIWSPGAISSAFQDLMRKAEIFSGPLKASEAIRGCCRRKSRLRPLLESHPGWLSVVWRSRKTSLSHPIR